MNAVNYDGPALEIDGLGSQSYHKAILAVAIMINRIMGTAFTAKDDWDRLEHLCKALGITFDTEGNILK